MRTRPRRIRRAPRIRPEGLSRDPYALYEAAVQAVDYDLDFIERVYRGGRGRRFRDFREDFCATAHLAAQWVLRRPQNRAWGVDLDPRPLRWCRRHRLPVMREAAGRLTLIRRDVRAVRQPKVDVVAALNFSYWVFKRRPELLEYFRAVRRSLKPGGMLVVNAFGGTEAMAALVEKRRVAATNAVDGSPIGPFTYLWEHVSFDAIDHHIVCRIHFRFPDGTRMRRAFTYDWRLWSLPEVEEAMLEAGFADAEIYVEGWDDKKNVADGIYRRRRRFPNQEGWLAYVVGRV
jgi:SAM-dependent methyltransferase